MSNHDDLIAHLQDIGMSGYEAKAYLALIASDRPMNGYEVAKHSGVPRSTVYETLGKLAARGAAFEVNSGSDTTTYVALPADALLRRVRDRVDQSLAGLATELDALVRPRQAPGSHHVAGREAVVERVIDLFATARQSVFIMAWPDELALVEPSILAAHARSLAVVVVQSGDDGDLTATDDHRLMVVVKDSAQVVVAGTTKAAMWGHYSDDPAVVQLAVDDIRRELVIRALTDHAGATSAELLAQVPDLRLLERLRPSAERKNSLRAVAGASRKSARR